MTDGSTLALRVEGPFFVPPSPGNIRSAHYLRGFNTVVRTLGGDYRKILEHHDIDVAAIEHQDYPLSSTAGGSMLEHCGRILNDSSFGVHLADNQDADVFGCLTSMARAAPSLRLGLETFVKFLPVFHCPGADLQLVTTDDVAEFRWPQCAFVQEQQPTCHGLLLAVKFLRSLVGHEFRPMYAIAICDIGRRNLADIENRLQCKVHPKATASAIAFPAYLLDRPLKTSEPIAFHLLQNYLAQVGQANRPTIVDQVKALVRWALPPGNWTMERCAAKLGVSARALQKRLRAANVQFSEIVEEQRMYAAKHALLESERTLDEIASHLGYSEQSSFGRAFKRWTTLTPQAYRDARGCN